MLNEFGSEFIIKENIVCARLSKPLETTVKDNILADTKIKQIEKNKIDDEKLKETRAISLDERKLLHQSFVHKTSAKNYINEIGGDILDEILDLSSIDEEWITKLNEIEKSPIEENFIAFTNNVLNVYVGTINNLFEFTALAYALTSLGLFIKENAKVISEDSSKVKKMIMLLEHLGKDLASWREHIFVLQNTVDIHYLDSSFFSSCMQIEGIMTDKGLGSDGDNDMEFF
ncbi:MAG TPA: hypothetical protein CFH78_07040 [Sulfurimonas sp. UBA10385]|nr:MAG TPA: hypothetical protein CFH78_07040 [Sulfurimonas sp. UBA10385]